MEEGMQQIQGGCKRCCLSFASRSHVSVAGGEGQCRQPLSWAEHSMALDRGWEKKALVTSLLNHHPVAVAGGEHR